MLFGFGIVTFVSGKNDREGEEEREREEKREVESEREGSILEE